MEETEVNDVSTSVLVRAVTLGGDRNDIAEPRRVLENLTARYEEVAEAIEGVARTLRGSATRFGAEQPNPEWEMSELRATFSVTLGVDAGVLVSKVSAEATLEVEVTISRTRA